jgi:hypothetical protein
MKTTSKEYGKMNALEWYSNISEGTTSLGLGKRVTKAYKEKEDSQEKYVLFNNITSINDFIKGLSDNGLYVEHVSSAKYLDYYRVKSGINTVHNILLVSDRHSNTVCFPSNQLYNYILNQEKPNSKLNNLMSQDTDDTDTAGIDFNITLDNPIPFDIFIALVNYIKNYLNL